MRSSLKYLRMPLPQERFRVICNQEVKGKKSETDLPRCKNTRQEKGEQCQHTRFQPGRQWHAGRAASTSSLGTIQAPILRSKKSSILKFCIDLLVAAVARVPLVSKCIKQEDVHVAQCFPFLTRFTSFLLYPRYS